jgi:hypothetical protein
MWGFVMDKSGAGAGFLGRTSVSPANLHSTCFFTIIFTITRGWHNRPRVAAVPIASQTRIKTKIFLLYSEMALSRKPFGIGHMYIYTFLIRMIDTVTSQNIDLFSWNMLKSCEELHFGAF